MTDVLVAGCSAPPDSPGRVWVRAMSTGGSLGPEQAGAAVDSPTWCIQDEATGFLHVASEVDSGAVLTLRLQQNGGLMLHHLTTVASGGSAPCHLALTHDGAHLVTANYGDGAIGLIRLDGSGAAGELVDVVNVTGTGPVADRQEGSHPHQVVPVAGDERTTVDIVDLGTDRILRYRVQDDHLVAGPVTNLPAGFGPRHLAREKGTGGRTFVLGELSGQLLTLAPWTSEDSHVLDVRDSSTAGAAALGAHIHHDSARGLLYITNRGPHTISVFDVRGERPRLCAERPTAVHPRQAGVTPNHLLVGGRWHNAVFCHPLDENGLPLAPVVTPVQAPTCLVPLHAPPAQ